MPGHRAMGRFKLVIALGGHQDAGHHSKTAKSCGDHIAHHIAIIVLAGPDKPTLAPHHSGDGVVDEGVLIADARRGKPILVIGVKNALEYLLELPVVYLQDGVLGGEPEILMGAEGIFKACLLYTSRCV